MLKIKSALIVLLFILPMQAFAEVSQKEIALAIAETALLPAYKNLSDKAKNMAENWPVACDLEESQRLYHETADAWAAVQHINFGPMSLYLRHHRFYHWPERRNAVAKAIGKALEKEDDFFHSSESFAKASVAVQGLPALERVLFTDFKDEPKSCALSQAIVANLSMIASALASDWSELAIFLKKEEEHPLYFDTYLDFNNQIFTQFITGFQVISDQKILPAYKKYNGKLAESWRSDRSGRNVQLTARALVQMAESYLPLLSPSAQDQLKTQFNLYQVAIDQFPTSVKEAVMEEAGRAELDAFLQVHKATRDLIIKHITGELGLKIGFNSLDGD